MSATPSKKGPKASERLTALEAQMVPIIENTNATARRTGEMEMIIYNLSRESEILREALQLFHEKLDAVITLTNKSEPLTDDNINAAVVEAKTVDLANRVKVQLEEGKIALAEEINENSFVVGRELNKDGTVANPRLQFIMGRLVPELQEKFTGIKTGELVTTEGEDKLDIEIMEIYDFVEQELELPENFEDGADSGHASEEEPTKE